MFRKSDMKLLSVSMKKIKVCESVYVSPPNQKLSNLLMFSSWSEVRGFELCRNHVESTIYRSIHDDLPEFMITENSFFPNSEVRVVGF